MESSQSFREVVVRAPAGAGLHDLAGFGRFEVDRCSVSTTANRVSALVELDPDVFGRLREAGWDVEELPVPEGDINELFAPHLAAWAEQWGLPMSELRGGRGGGETDPAEGRS